MDQGSDNIGPNKKRCRPSKQDKVSHCLPFHAFSAQEDILVKNENVSFPDFVTETNRKITEITDIVMQLIQENLDLKYQNAFLKQSLREKGESSNENPFYDSDMLLCQSLMDLQSI